MRRDPGECRVSLLATAYRFRQPRPLTRWVLVAARWTGPQQVLVALTLSGLRHCLHDERRQPDDPVLVALEAALDHLAAYRRGVAVKVDATGQPVNVTR